MLYVLMNNIMCQNICLVNKSGGYKYSMFCVL
jgi:hypothetical protein